jgi:hypothetical protein
LTPNPSPKERAIIVMKYLNSIEQAIKSPLLRGGFRRGAK